MARKKRTKKLTINELQSYIEGAVELNADDWHPDAAQWDQIVEMIMNVKLDTRLVEVAAPVTGTGARPPLVEQGPSSMMSDDGEQLVNMPSSGRFDASAHPEARPTVQKIGEAGQKNEDGSYSSGIVVKTPNIDSSQGGDKSGFKSGFE